MNINTRGVQNNYSKIKPENIFDQDGREVKAKKIMRILEHYSGKNLKQCKILDYGCAAGMMDIFLSEKVNSIVGYDIDEDAVRYAKTMSKGIRNIRFVSKLQDVNSIFDIIICNQIYEHVQSVERMLNEISTLLKEDGVVYFGATNKFIIIEPHHNLPFLSWFPKPVSNFYLYLFKKGVYYEDLRDYNSLKYIVSKHFVVQDITDQVIKHPDFFSAKEIRGINIFKYLPIVLIKVLIYFSPNWIWLLSKKNE